MAQHRRDQSPGLGAGRAGAGELGKPSPSPPWDGVGWGGRLFAQPLRSGGIFLLHGRAPSRFPVRMERVCRGGTGRAGLHPGVCARDGGPLGPAPSPCWSRGAPRLSACQTAPLPGSSTAGADICASSPACLRFAPRHGAGGSLAGALRSLRVAFPCHQNPSMSRHLQCVPGGETEAAGRDVAELPLNPNRPQARSHASPRAVLSCRARTS